MITLYIVFNGSYHKGHRRIPAKINYYGVLGAMLASSGHLFAQERSYMISWMRSSSPQGQRHRHSYRGRNCLVLGPQFHLWGHSDRSPCFYLNGLERASVQPTHARLNAALTATLVKGHLIPVSLISGICHMDTWARSDNDVKWQK